MQTTTYNFFSHHFMMKLTMIYCCSFLYVKNLYAYTNFIGYGYKTCLTCHYNAYGNGPLNDYGRALSANLISAKWPYPGATDETVSNYSQFFGKYPNNSWIRPSFDHRGLSYTKSVGQEGSETTRYIQMQNDFNIVLKAGKRDRYVASFTYGYAPVPQRASQEEQDKRYISREHYLRVRMNKEWHVYLGFMDHVFGLRVPDHVAFSKISTGLAQNDQTHGALIHYNRKTYEVGLHLFQGNLNQDEELRQKGGSARVDFDVGKDHRVGGSLFHSSNKFLSKSMLSTHARFAFSKGSSIISEIGYVFKDPLLLPSSPTIKDYYWFNQGLIRLARGVNFILTTEFFQPNIDQNNEITFRLSPGLMIFPMQRVELRAELVNTRKFSDESLVPDTWDMMLQVHVWL